MKIRSGFVSNSSSSSFILDFGKVPTVNDIKSFLYNFGTFEDLEYSATCFLENMKQLDTNDIDIELANFQSDYNNDRYGKSWKEYCKEEIERLEKLKKTVKKSSNPIYEIWISDHRDEDPWAIMNVKHHKEKNGEEWLDYDSLENEMSWCRDSHKEIIGYKNGH